jgi:hypothetical protein
MEVKGRNLSEGIPRSFIISSNEILEALTDPLNQIVSSVKMASCFRGPPPHCCATWTVCSPKRPAPAGAGRRRAADLRRAWLRHGPRAHGQIRGRFLLRMRVGA